MGESQKREMRVDFDDKLGLGYRRVIIASDAELLADCEFAKDFAR
jgi:hypothetical protein